MIIHEVDQGSADWWSLRLGLPTASAFGRIVTNSATWLVMKDGETLSRHTKESTAQSAADKAAKKFPEATIWTESVYELSSQAEGYTHALLAEWLMGVPADDYQSKWMERGTELEPEAWEFYEFQQDVEVTRGGFVTNDSRTLGCSPDGRVYDGDILVGGVELKCPSPQHHMGYLLGGKSVADAYRHQVQGCLLLTGAKWWDILSYHPSLPPAIVRCTPDDDPKYLKALGNALDSFVEGLEQAKEKLREQGYNGKKASATQEAA